MKSPLDKAAGHEVVWQQVSALFEAARQIRGCEFVYLITESGDGPVKIGTAKDPIARLRGMQTGNPRRLRIDHVVIGDAHTEAILHELWEPYAIHAPRRPGKVGTSPGTEWFEAGVRTDLFPVAATAAAEQIKYITGTTGDVHVPTFEHIIREAHIAHGLTLRGRDQVRLLGAGGGYAVQNRSRL